jgi:hypothetical protein
MPCCAAAAAADADADAAGTCAGTYNNQYIVVDLKLFSPGAELQQGLLTIVEQMPGLVMTADKTQVGGQR